MAITLATEAQKEIPAITLDCFHLDSFQIKQARVPQGPRKIIDGVAVRYGKDVNGDSVFDTETIQASTKDIDASFFAYVMAKTGQSLEEVMADVVAARAAVNTEYAAGNISDAEMMAYVELAISYFFQVMGKFEIGGIE